MDTTLKNNDACNTIKKRSYRSSAMIVALALGVGMTLSTQVHAGLIITEIGHTLIEGQTFEVDVNGDTINDLEFIIENGEGYVRSFDQVRFSEEVNTRYAHIFSAGDTVDTSWFDGSQGVSSPITGLYDSTDGGAWSTIGTQGYLGFVYFGSGSNQYGWLDITRGSLTIGQLGFQSTVGATAQIASTPVSAPGTMALIASGALGLLGLRRRNRVIVVNPQH